MSKKDMIFQQDTLENMINDKDGETAEQIFDYTFNSFSKSYSDYLKNYKTLWIFELSNSGGDVVSDIFVVLPHRGKYLISMTGLESKFADFNKRIPVGDMMVGDETTIFAWTEEDLDDYSAYHGDITKIATRNGIVDIVYPTKTTGLLAWNIQKDNYPLIMAMAALFITIMVLVIVFYNLGARHNKTEDGPTHFNFGQNA